VKARGGRVVLLPLIAGVSTTATLARIADSVAREP
jgi:bifunctional ADP-heptose synthase (sugar kinase/adenylyltransferase)